MRGDLLRINSAIIPLSINFNSTNKKPNKSGIMSSGVFHERSVVKKARVTFCEKVPSLIILTGAPLSPGARPDVRLSIGTRSKPMWR